LGLRKNDLRTGRKGNQRIGTFKMPIAAYDFAKDRYFLLLMTSDGPSRIQGHTTYDSYEKAEKAAHDYLREGYKSGSLIISKVADLVAIKVTTELVSKSAKK
jgi:hypothetical protein